MSFLKSLAQEDIDVLRQAEVYATGIFARIGDPPLRELVERTAATCGLPLVCLVVWDRDREAIVASHGFRPKSLPLGSSRFENGLSPRSHPWIAGTPHAAFAVCAPLHTPRGQRFGALYALDTQPRDTLFDGVEETLRAHAELLAAEIFLESARSYFSAHAIEPIVQLIREAARDDREALVIALDAILRGVEKRVRA